MKFDFHESRGLSSLEAEDGGRFSRKMLSSSSFGAAISPANTFCAARAASVRAPVRKRSEVPIESRSECTFVSIPGQGSSFLDVIARRRWVGPGSSPDIRARLRV